MAAGRVQVLSGTGQARSGRTGIKEMKLPLQLSFAAAGLFLALPVTAAFADATIKVSLWDKGPDSVMMDDAHMKMMGKMDMKMASMGMMGIKLDKTSVPAGKVTFDVTNDSKDIVHEMMVSPVPEGKTELPYVADENRVDEEAAGHLGEVSELDPGKGGSLTVDLKPGSYIVYCNIPGHFVGGMWTMLTVTK
jgi:uncharacterized cupredoxin-like copper-binding protein